MSIFNEAKCLQNGEEVLGALLKSISSLLFHVNQTNQQLFEQQNKPCSVLFPQQTTVETEFIFNLQPD